MQRKGGAPGQWHLIGQTHATHTADHDAILVQGPHDSFRALVRDEWPPELQG
jgi:hypothetical protein